MAAGRHYNSSQLNWFRRFPKNARVMRAKKWPAAALALPSVPSPGSSAQVSRGQTPHSTLAAITPYARAGKASGSRQSTSPWLKEVAQS